MDYSRLEHFIKKEMSMTHIYQPVMIKKLLESGNRATKVDIAKEFVDLDNSLLKYYEGRVMTWPKITLTKHKIVRYKKNVFTLLLEDITEKQRKRLIELCDLRTDEYVEKFQNRIGIKKTRNPISSSIRYDIIAKAKGICVACGITGQKRQLDVDHIVPLNVGGTNDPCNLQVLCSRCNRQKRDRDKTDFVRWHKRLKHKNPGCGLCKATPVQSNTLASTIPSDIPDADLHHLVYPHRHVSSFFDLIPAEKSHCIALLDSLKKDIVETDRTISGFQVSFDSRLEPGRHAHCHINVVPTR